MEVVFPLQAIRFRMLADHQWVENHLYYLKGITVQYIVFYVTKNYYFMLFYLEYLLKYIQDLSDRDTHFLIYPFLICIQTNIATFLLSNCQSDTLTVLFLFNKLKHALT